MNDDTRTPRLANPFVVGRYAGSEYFCDREDETFALRNHIDNGRDVALISPRRMGKTGLIAHAFAAKEWTKEHICFFVDIYPTSCLAEMVYLLGKAIFERLKTRPERLLDGFMAALSSLKSGFSIDALSGEPRFELSIGEIGHPQTTLDEIFRYLEAAPLPCVVAIDEFQQIGQYPEKNVEAVLRTHIQHCANARFVFAGSQRHTMANMFASGARPFYQSTLMMNLGAIPKDTYGRWAQEKFSLYGKTLSWATFENVYSQMNGTTWYVQMMLNELFSLTQVGGECGTGMVATALRNIVDVQGEGYRLMLGRLTPRQRELLVAIARDGEAAALMSARFVKAHSLGSPSIVQAALRALLADELVTRETAPDGYSFYRLYDYFLAAFVRQTF